MRVGFDDAQVLQKELGQYGAEDLLNLQVGEAIVRMGVAKDSFNLQIPLLQKPKEDHSKEILKLTNDYVFSSSVGTKINQGNLRRAFGIARKKAGIEDFRFHDLRHTFATRLVQAGVDLYKVQKLLEHTKNTFDDTKVCSPLS